MISARRGGESSLRMSHPDPRNVRQIQAMGRRLREKKGKESVFLFCFEFLRSSSPDFSNCMLRKGVCLMLLKLLIYIPKLFL